MYIYYVYIKCNKRLFHYGFIIVKKLYFSHHNVKSAFNLTCTMKKQILFNSRQEKIKRFAKALDKYYKCSKCQISLFILYGTNLLG